MSTTIDNRVVKMTFDNAKFEKGIRETIKSITEFEGKLNFKGATAGFDRIKEATNKLNFLNLNKKTEEAGENLEGLSKTAQSSFEKISKSADGIDFSKIGENAGTSFNKLSQAADNVDLSGIGNSANKAVSDAENAFGSIDMSSVVHETDRAAEGFNAFSVIATGALLEVGAQIEGFITGKLGAIASSISGIFNNAFIQPIKDGFEEYQTQIGSIQTIMANTGRDFHASADIADVNAALDELNAYADKTIYNFTEMTRNIGTFTAAGVSMEDAIPAIQGIANLAALSGSTSQQASTAMYQLSQALSAGTVKLMDWNSVVNAGMGGKVFQDKLLETAKHIYTVNEGYEGMLAVVNDVVDGNVSFRDSLEEEWITSDVLTEALTQMTYAQNDMTAAEKAAAIAHLESLGYTSEEIDQVFLLGQTAMESATKVRTWSQLWDTVGEALGSGWTTTWRTIIGDFQEATNLFTYLSNIITDVVGTIDNARNSIVEGWALFGGRDILFGTFTESDTGELIVTTNGILQNLVDAITGWVKPISDAFSDVFEIFGVLDEGVSADEYDADYARALKTGAEEAEQYRQQYLQPFIEQFGEDSQELADQVAFLDHTADLYNNHTFDNIDPKTLLLDDVAQQFVSLTDDIRSFVSTLIPTETAMTGLYGIFQGLFSAIKMVVTIVGALLKVFGSAIEIARVFIDPLIDIALYIGGTFGRALSVLCDYVVLTVNAFKRFVDQIVGRVKPALKSLVDGFLNLLDIPGKIEIVYRFITNLVDLLWNFIDIPGKIDAAGAIIGGVFDTIKTLLFGTKESAEGTGDAFDGLFTIIGKVFAGIRDSIYNTFPFIREFVEGIFEFYNVISRGDLETNKTYFGNLLETIKNSIRGVLGPLVELKNAIGSFIGRFIDFVKNLEIVKNAIDIFNGFKSSIVGVFQAISNKTFGFGSKIKNELTEAASGFNVLSKIQSVSDYFRNVTIEQFLSDAKNFKNNFIDHISSAFEVFKNLDIEDVSGYVSGSMYKIQNNLMVASGKIKDVLVETFPEAEDGIKTGWNSVNLLMAVGIQRFSEIIQNAEANSDSVPEFIFNLFKYISDAINESVVSLIQYVENIKLSDIIGLLIKPLEAFRDFLKDNFPGLSGVIDTLINSLLGFKNHLEATGKTLGGAVMDGFRNVVSILESLAPGVMDWIKKIGTAFSGLPEGIVTGIKWITSALSHLPGIFGTIFGGLHKIITGYVFGSKANAEEMPDTYNTMFSGARTESEETGDALDKFFNMFDPNNVVGSLKEMAKTIIENLKEQFEKVKEYIKTLPDKMNALLDELSDPNSRLAGIIQNLEEVVKGIIMYRFAGFIKTMGRAISGFLANLGASMRNFTKYLVKKETNDFSEKLKNIAEAIVMVGIVVAVLSQIKLEDLVKGGVTVAAIGVLLTLMAVIPAALEKSKGIDFGGAATSLMKTAASILAVSVALHLLLAAIKAITSTEIPVLIQGLVEIGIGIGALLLIMKKLGGPETLSAGLGLMAMAVAMWIMVPALQKMTEVFLDNGAFSWDKVGAVTAGLVAILAAVGELILLTRSTKTGDVMGSATAMLAFSGAVMVLSIAMSLLAGIEVGKIVAAGGALTALIMSFFVLTKFTEVSDLMPSALALLAFSGAVIVMSAGLSILAKLDMPGILSAAGAIVALVVSLTILSVCTKESDLLTTSAALIVFGLAVAAMSAGLSILAKMDMPGILSAAGAIAALVISLTILSAFTKESDLLTTSAALIVFGLAVAAMSAGLSILAKLDMPGILSAAGGIAILVGSLLLLSILTKESDLLTTSAALIVFGLAVDAMCLGLMVLAKLPVDQLVAGALAIGGLVVVVGLLASFVDSIDILATSAGLLIFSASVVVMAIALTQFANIETDKILIGAAAISILLAVFGVLAAVLAQVGPLALVILPVLALAFVAVGGAALLIANGISVAVDAFIRLAEAAPVIATFVQTIAENLLNFVAAAAAFVAIGAGMVILSLGMGVLSIGLGVFGLACGAAAGGIGLLNLALGAFLDLASRFQEFSEAGSNITAGVGQGISSGTDLVTQAILGIGSAILNTILGFFGIHSPSTVMAEQVGQFLPAGIAEGIDMNSGSMTDSLGEGLGGLLGQFSTWVTDEGLPKLQEFGNGLLDKLKNEILPNITTWVQNEGIPELGRMAQGVVDHIFEELGKLPGKLLEMILGIPQALWEGLQGIWGEITRIGSEIMNGIVEGIQSMPGAIADAVTGMASGGLDAIKNFFGISSPSRVMKEQVGQYIPLGLAEGISKYSKIAVNSAVAMAESTLQGVKNSLDVDAFDGISIPSINKDSFESFNDYDDLYDFPNPHIKPILDLDSTFEEMDSRFNMLDSLDLSTTQTNLSNISADLDLSSLGSSLNDQSRRMADLTSQNEKLVNELNNLRSDMAAYTEAINNSAIVMDSGALVGAIVPDVDNALGRRQNMAVRGVI